MTPRDLFSWFSEQEWSKPWLVLGKGPSFSRRDEVDLADYHLLGLNHVCREVPVDLAHAIDLDVVEQLGETLFERAGALVMPWRPHVDFKPGELTLAQLTDRLPLLARLAGEGRLLWYNCSTSPEPRWGSPIMRVCYFSKKAGVRLLAMCGEKRVRTLGIDGGRGYASEFRDLRPLTNGVNSFDAQTLAIQATVQEFGLDFAPLLGAGGVPSELLGEVGQDALVVSAGSWTEGEVWPAGQASAAVCLEAPADHARPVRLIQALYAALIPDGKLYVCVGDPPAGSDWLAAGERLQASRWFLAEGFVIEEERRLADRRNLLVCRRRSARSPAWSQGEADPRFTVLAVSFESCLQVMDLIGAVRGFTRSPYRMIVVDNASQDGVRPFLRRLAHEPGITLITNEQNAQCAGATNAGIKACTTEYVVGICPSHGLVMGEGWERALLDCLEKSPGTWIAGDLWYPRMRPRSARYAPGWDPDRLSRDELLHVQGGAWIARRELFERFGLFAEEDYPQGGMDVELSFRLISHGEKLGRCPAIVCPPWPDRAIAPPGGSIVHPAHGRDRERVRSCLWRCSTSHLSDLNELEARLLSNGRGRLLFLVREAPEAGITYGERLAGELAERGWEVVLSRRNPGLHPRKDRAWIPGRPLVSELESRCAGSGNDDLSLAAEIEGQLTPVAQKWGPFKAVFAEGGLCALAASPVAQRVPCPFFLMLDGSEVERRSNRMSPEQFELAAAEQQGADCAHAVLVPDPARAGPVSLFYNPKEVWSVAASGRSS